ncbi:unnamed protein product [Calypogeia fissa]
MLRPSRCPVSDLTAAPSEKLFQQQLQFAFLHTDSLQSSNKENSSLGASNLKVFSHSRGMKGSFGSGFSTLDGSKFTRTSVQREGPSRWNVVGAARDGNRDKRGGVSEGDLNVTQIMETAAATATVAPRRGGRRQDDIVEVQIEKLGNNSRKIVAKITIEAPLDNVWAILTDYEHLADFIPGLAVNELLEKRHNGARLYQVGEQNIALGLKFKAKAVVDCEEKPKTVHADFIRRDIDFQNVEGDFQIFRGTWRMEQLVSKASSDSSAPSAPSSDATAGGGGGDGSCAGEKITTILSYILVVQPMIWLPVALVEGRLTSEMKTNLVCIRDKSLQPSLG